MKKNHLKAMTAFLFFVLVIGYSLTGGKIARIEAAQKEGPNQPGVELIQHRLIHKNAHQEIQEGKRTFRFETFGDEAFWGGQLQLHQAIAGVSPKDALALGLKVSSRALPPELINQVKQGQVDLDDPAVTLALLKLNAVVGVTGFFNQDDGALSSIGLQCALCHSTVDNSFRAPGIPAGLIGQRLDGWANRDLNVGAIIALAPNLKPYTDLLKIVDPTIDDIKVRAVLNS